MTDKEKRELKDGVISIFKRFNILDYTVTLWGLRDNILRYIDSIQEEPKKCMYTKDDFTEEDRKILCEDCEEECEYAKKEEPVSENLEDAASSFARKDSKEISNPANFYYTVADKARIFKAGAEWMHKKMIHEFNLKEE